MVQEEDEGLEECGIEELYGEPRTLPQTEHLWVSKLERVKNRLEELYRIDREEFYQRKKLIEQAIQERERGQTRTMPELNLEELREVLRSANRLYG